MKILKFVLLTFAILNLNGCLLTYGLVHHANKKKYIFPTETTNQKGPVISTYANKDRTKFIINFSANHNSKIKRYSLKVDKNFVINKLPKDFMKTHFQKSYYSKHNVTYTNRNNIQQYRIKKFKKKHYASYEITLDYIDLDEFHRVEPIVNHYTRGKSSYFIENELSHQLNFENPIGIMYRNTTRGRSSSPNIFIKSNLHGIQHNEILKFNLTQTYKKPFNLFTLIFTPASVATDIVTFPLQAVAVIIAISTNGF